MLFLPESARRASVLRWQARLHGLRLRTAAGAASAGSGSRCPRRRRVATPEQHAGLGGLRERELDERRLDRGQPVEQVRRVEAGGDVVAGDGGLERLDGLASSPLPASRVSTPSVNASWTAVLRSATSETRLTESTRAALSTRGDGQVLAREQRAHLGEVAVEQPGRRPSYAAAGRALEADEALAGRRTGWPARW